MVGYWKFTDPDNLGKDYINSDDAVLTGCRSIVYPGSWSTRSGLDVTTKNFKGTGCSLPYQLIGRHNGYTGPIPYKGHGKVRFQ
jgi:hypothetical protein